MWVVEMEETRSRKLAAIFLFLVGLYGIGSFIANGSLFTAFFAIGIILSSALAWFGI
jgi:hypothetical protein